ncbi:GGDEF domain-containing protein [Sneathiella limimaris]|uniref:GGDEF domain-containing protein n=1 Tax=Sneathiella limimaris TaxID=1964213 RepID=UPI00146D43DE|nr:diguanylate cyclase [Sneathiella limimaris]
MGAANLAIHIGKPMRLLLVSKREQTKALFQNMVASNQLLALDEVNLDEVGEKVKNSSLPTLLVITEQRLDKAMVAQIQRWQSDLPAHQFSILFFLKSQDLKNIPDVINANYFDYALEPVSEHDCQVRIALAIERLFREEAFNLIGQRDTLTGLLGRLAFLERGRALFASAERDQITLSCVMLSLDDVSFSGNSLPETEQGKILLSVSEILEKRQRDTDLLCRYRENIFCILAVNMRTTHLYTFMDDLALAVQSQNYMVKGHPLQISIGATNKLGLTLDAMLRQTEAALLESIKKGNNAITVQSEASELETNRRAV